MDGRGGIRGNCERCNLLADIYEMSLKLNALIRRFNPGHDDLTGQPQPGVPADPNQLSLWI